MALFTNDITHDHREKRDRLASRFPAARSFLVALEDLHGEAGGRFHLGTDQNLHLYLEGRFLVYVRIEGLASSRPSLIFSPRAHNDHIKEGTSRTPELLFPKALVRLIDKHRGGSGGWAKRNLAQDNVEVATGAPAAFFEDLLAEIRALR